MSKHKKFIALFLSLLAGMFTILRKNIIVCFVQKLELHAWVEHQIQISKFAFYPSVDDLIVLAYGAVYILRYTIMDKT